MQKTIQFKPNASLSTTYTTTYTNAAFANGAAATWVQINDASPRTVKLELDLQGQILKRTQTAGSGTDRPGEYFFRFGGKQMGYAGNNGTLDTSYATTIGVRTAAQGTGPFRNGATTASAYADFDQSIQPITSYNTGSSGGAYVVREGDTLSKIAAALWGDASLWYQLAEANGIAGEAALSESQSLIIPTGVMKNTHNASTFTPYDPNEIIGDTTPSMPAQAKPKKQRCGAGDAFCCAGYSRRSRSYRLPAHACKNGHGSCGGAAIGSRQPTGERHGVCGPRRVEHRRGAGAVR